MRVIGLTGGIGMGKSNAARVFRRAGVPVFDADAEVHRLQAPGTAATRAIGAAFPGTVRAGVLDRAALRAVVLADRAALARLEAIVHPLVGAARVRFLRRCRAAGAPLVVLDIPLLFEGSGDALCDLVVVVSAPADVQRARVRARRRMDDAQIDALLALQMPDAEKRARAGVVLRTGLSRHRVEQAVRRLVRVWTATTPPPRRLPRRPAGRAAGG